MPRRARAGLEGDEGAARPPGRFRLEGGVQAHAVPVKYSAGPGLAGGEPFRWLVMGLSLFRVLEAAGSGLGPGRNRVPGDRVSAPVAPGPAAAAGQVGWMASVSSASVTPFSRARLR